MTNTPANTASMQGSTYLIKRNKRQPWGLGLVVLLHLGVFWALQAGLGQLSTRDTPRQIPEVVQAKLLPMSLQPPPPAALPAPKIEPTPPPKPAPAAATPPTPAPSVPKPQAAPPALVPPVEVAVTVSTAPTQAITAVPNPMAQNAATSPATPPTATATATAPVPTSTLPSVSERPSPPARTAASVSAAQCVKPEYPSASRRMEEEGTVSLRFLVSAEGQVLQSAIEKSSGFKRLDEAALAGLSKCRFQPATVDGRPESSWASMKYTWQLE